MRFHVSTNDAETHRTLIQIHDMKETVLKMAPNIPGWTQVSAMVRTLEIASSHRTCEKVLRSATDKATPMVTIDRARVIPSEKQTCQIAKAER